MEGDAHEQWEDEHDAEEEEEEEDDDGERDGGDDEDAAAQLAAHVAEAARARGLSGAAAGSAMQVRAPRSARLRCATRAHAARPTQALLRKLGGGLEDLVPGGGGGTHSRLKDILTGLRAMGDESAQMEALTNLCELLSMSTEEALAYVFWLCDGLFFRRFSLAHFLCRAVVHFPWTRSCHCWSACWTPSTTLTRCFLRRAR